MFQVFRLLQFLILIGSLVLGFWARLNFSMVSSWSLRFSCNITVKFTLFGILKCRAVRALPHECIGFSQRRLKPRFWARLIFPMILSWRILSGHIKQIFHKNIFALKREFQKAHACPYSYKYKCQVKMTRHFKSIRYRWQYRQITMKKSCLIIITLLGLSRPGPRSSTSRLLSVNYWLSEIFRPTLAIISSEPNLQDRQFQARGLRQQYHY